MIRKQEHRIYDGPCRTCIKDTWHGRDNGTHGLSQKLICLYPYCDCKEFVPTDNLDYLEYLSKRRELNA